MPIEFVRKKIVQPGLSIIQDRIITPIQERTAPAIQWAKDRGSQIVDSFRRNEPPPEEEVRRVFAPEEVSFIRDEQQIASDFVAQLEEGTTFDYNPKLNVLLDKAKIDHKTDTKTNQIVITTNPTSLARERLVNEVGAEAAERILKDIERKEIRPEIEFRDPTVLLTKDEEQLERTKELVGKWQFLQANPSLAYTFYPAVGTMMDTDKVTQFGLVREDLIKFNEVLGDENLRQRAEIETNLLKDLGHLEGANKVLTTLFRPIDYYFTEAPAYQTIEEVNLQKDLKNISDNAPEIEELANKIFMEKTWNLPVSWSFKNHFADPKTSFKDTIQRINNAWRLNKKDIQRGNKNAEAQLKYLLKGQELGIIQDKSDRMQGLLEEMDTINRMEKIEIPLNKANNEFEKLLDADGNVPEENIEEWNRLVEKQRPLINQYNELVAEYNYITRHAEDLSERYISTLTSMGVKHEVGMDGSIKITDKEFLDAFEPYTPYLKRVEDLGVSSGKINFARQAGRITSVAAETAAFVALIAFTKGLGKAAVGLKSGVKLKIVGGNVAKTASKKGLARVLTLQGIKQTARLVAPKALMGGIMGIKGYNEAMREYAETGDIRAAVMMGVAGAAVTYGVIKAFQVPSKVMRARELERWKQASFEAKRATDNAVRQMWSGQPIFDEGGKYVGRQPEPFWKWGVKTVHFEVSDVSRIKQTKNLFVTTKHISEKEISRISIASATTKPMEFPRYKVIILQNQITGKKIFRVIPDIPRKIYANSINFNFVMKDGKQFALSTMGLSHKPLPAFESYEKFLRMTKGKKFFFMKHDPQVSQDIYMSIEAKNIKMVDGQMQIVPYKTKDTQYLMKQYGFNPEKGTFEVETRLAPKDWEKIYKEVNEAYKVAPKVGQAKIKTKFKPGDKVPRRFLERIFEYNKDIPIIDDKGNFFLVNQQYSVFDQATGKINYEFGLALSKKETVVTNLNKIQYWLNKHFDSFGNIPRSKLIQISNQETINSLKKYYSSLQKGQPIITKTLGDIDKLDPILKRQVLSASELKNKPITSAIKPQETINYGSLQDLIAPDVRLAPPFKAPIYTPPTPSATIDYAGGLLAKEKLLKGAERKLKTIQEELKPTEITTNLQRKVGIELQEIGQTLTRTDYHSEVREIGRQVNQTQFVLEREKQKEKEMTSLLAEQRTENLVRLLEKNKQNQSILQKQLQKLKQQQAKALKLSKMFQGMVNLFNQINAKYQLKPIKDLPYFDFPRIRMPPRRTPKVVEGQGYIALWLHKNKWFAISPVLNRNGAVYEGFTNTLRNPEVRRFRVRRINYRRVGVFAGFEEPPNHLFKKVKYDRIGKVPVEEEWIQRKTQ